MCGISGIIGPRSELENIRAMVAVQAHRGPDDCGVYLDETARVALGHNRLSIIDISKSGAQPMSDSHGAVWITFNGEIYNYRELKKELKDYEFKTNTDTEIILAAYEKWGEECIQHFIGMFGFAIWDERRRKLFCARDRLGIKPFHYYMEGGSFLFSSEIKAILQVVRNVEPDYASWRDYLNAGYYDHSSRTFFRDIQALAPGHTLVWENDRIIIREYWNLYEKARSISTGDSGSAAEEWESLLRSSIDMRLRSDVPLGVNLSGGLDSSALITLLGQAVPAGSTISTFTSVYGDQRYDEDLHALSVPESRRCSSTRARLGSDEVEGVMNEAIWHQEAPVGGVSTLAYHVLHKRIAQAGVKVALEGQGVDELLAGYRYFRPYHYLDLARKRKTRELASLLNSSGCARKAEFDKMRAVRDGGALDVYQDGTAFLGTDCLSGSMSSAGRGFDGFPAPFEDALSNALYRDLRFTKLPRVLRMNDRLSMASSVELREPYLDHRLVEYSFALPGEMKIKDGRSKYLLRQIMSRYLPAQLCWDQKREVVAPQREWLRHELRPWVEGVINGQMFRSRGIFDCDAVKRRYQEYVTQGGENSFFIWQWINTELWFKTFFDASIRQFKHEANAIPVVNRQNSQ